MCEHHHEHEHKKSPVIRLVAALTIFAIALIADFTGITKFIVFLIAYLLAGGDVVLRAFKNILKGDFFD